MKVKQNILDLVDNPPARVRIAAKLVPKCGEQSVAYQMRKNSPYGRLTKMDALQAISEESGFPISEILEEDMVTVPAVAQK